MHVCVAVILGKRDELLATDKQFELAEACPRVKSLGLSNRILTGYHWPVSGYQECFGSQVLPASGLLLSDSGLFGWVGQQSVEQP